MKHFMFLRPLFSIKGLSCTTWFRLSKQTRFHCSSLDRQILVSKAKHDMLKPVNYFIVMLLRWSYCTLSITQTYRLGNNLFSQVASIVANLCCKTFGSCLPEFPQRVFLILARKEPQNPWVQAPGKPPGRRWFPSGPSVHKTRWAALRSGVTGTRLKLSRCHKLPPHQRSLW